MFLFYLSEKNPVDSFLFIMKKLLRSGLVKLIRRNEVRKLDRTLDLSSKAQKRADTQIYLQKQIFLSNIKLFVFFSKGPDIRLPSNTVYLQAYKK